MLLTAFFAAILVPTLVIFPSTAQETPLCDENCVFYETSWLQFPPQNNTLWLIHILSNSQEIGYDEGGFDGAWSIGKSTNTSGRGAAVWFNVDSTPFYLTGVKVYGRYYCNNTQVFCDTLLENQTFNIYILDSNLKYIAGFSYRYIDVFNESFGWRTVFFDQPVVINDTEFYVFIDTNSSAPWKDWYSGISIGYDEVPYKISPPRSYLMMWERVIPMNQPPTAYFTFDPSSPEVNQTVTFNASLSYDSDGYIINYQWDFGDGSTASGMVVTHAYTAPGIYVVTLTVTDNEGSITTTSKQLTVTTSTQTLGASVMRLLPDWVEPNSAFQVTLMSTVSAIGVQIVENVPSGFTLISWNYSGADNVDLQQSGNTLTFTVTDLTSADGFTITYILQSSSVEGMYVFSGTYQTLGGSATTIGGDTVIEVFVGETIPDSVDDALEQIISKYNLAFDWVTSSPTRQDVLNAVINAVSTYFVTSDQTVRQEILGDVIQLVLLYFNLQN